MSNILILMSMFYQINVVLSESCIGYTHMLVWPSQNSKNITQQLMDTVQNNTCILITNNINVVENVNITIDNLLITSTNIATPWIRCNNMDNKPGIGIMVFNSSNITISDINLKNCGYKHALKTMKDTNLVLSSGLHFENDTNVELCNVILNANLGYAAAFFDVSGNFILNTVTIEYGLVIPLDINETITNGTTYSSGSGVYIEYSSFYNKSGNTIHIKDSWFVNNYMNDDEFMITKKSEDLPFGKGGGLSIFIYGATSNNIFLFDSGAFDKNQAQYGGAIYIYLSSNTYENEFKFNNVDFLSNQAYKSGGAILVLQCDNNKNYFSYTKTKFRGNNASEGGALSYTLFSMENQNSISGSGFILHDLTDEESRHLGNLSMKDCYFIENNGGLGASIHFQNIKAVFTDIKIFESDSSSGATSLGNGGVYCYNSIVYFNGKNEIARNNNTALVLDCSKVSVVDSLLFADNFGYDGGAMGLYGHSQIILSQSSNLTFVRNTAENKGGAMLVNIPGPPLRPFNSTELKMYECFFWNTGMLDGSFKDFSGSVLFVNNSAHETGDNIHASSLQNCLQSYDHNDVMNIITNWTNFSFISNDSQATIQTYAVNMKLESKDNDWDVFPGKLFKPSIRLIDERGNYVMGTVNVTINSGDVKIESNPSFAVTPSNQVKISLLGKPNTSFDVTITTTEGLWNSKTILKRYLQFCPFGMIYNKTIANKCLCDVVNNMEMGVAECYSNQMYLFRNRWVPPDPQHPMGKVVKSSHLCPAGYCRECNTKNTSIYCLYEPLQQCADSRNQLSRLCSRCKESLSVAIGSEDCLNCKDTVNWIWISLIIIFGLSVFIALVLVFDLDIMSYHINSILYSYQVIDILYTPQQKISPVLMFIISIAEFTTKNSAYPKFCLWDGMNNLQKMAYNYIIPSWMFICIIMLYMWAKYRPESRLSKERCLRAFTIVGTMIYSDYTRISFWLLASEGIYGIKYVFIYAEAPYFGNEHLPYGILAYIVVIVFVFGVPVLLMMSPLLSSNKFPRFATPIILLQSVVEKYGLSLRSNCLYFLPFYYICRMLIFALGAFLPTEPIQYVALSLVCLVVCVTFTMIQPYKNNIDNYVEAILLSNLTTVALLSLGVESVYKTDYRDAFMYTIRTLSYVPLAVFLFAVVFKTARNMWIRCSYRRLIGGATIVPVPHRATVELNHDYHEYKD